MKSVQRVVCGGCLDYKVVVALDAGSFASWEAKKFEPEEAFLAAGENAWSMGGSWMDLKWACELK